MAARCGALLAIVTCVSWSADVRAECAPKLPRQTVSTRVLRALTLRDLVALRDIGVPDAAIATSSPLAISPDGRSVAFLINQADPETNAYCRALVVAPTQPSEAATIIDSGGELITLPNILRGMYVPGGFPAVVTPVWSPDGKWIAYLKRMNGQTQAWRVRIDGSRAEMVSPLQGDVEAVGWTKDGRRILYSTRPGIVSQKIEIEREGDSGYHYDDRVVTNSGPRPQIRADAPLVVLSSDVASGITRRASTDEAASLTPPAYLAQPVSVVSPGGRRAWTERIEVRPDAALRLFADANGKKILCDYPSCKDGISGLWWYDDRESILYQRREGWNREASAFYLWRPGKGAPKPLWRTTDVIQGCEPTKGRLICLSENSTTPRHIIALDLIHQRSSVIFDPNPEFRQIRLGRVVRIKWKNERGLEAWGDLVLPPGYRGAAPLPMVIVQYRSYGFLRGGTGDEYPIYALASRGIAVLSLERPPLVTSTVPNLTSWDDIVAYQYRNWSERRSLLSSLNSGIAAALATGFVDGDRIGISGLSDGATATRFAIIDEPRRFVAASISTCCLDPKTVMTYGGIAWAEYNRRMGFPLASEDRPDFWKPFSFVPNASSITVPLLMQLADDEYVLALETFEALREKGAPVEMYVYPNEYHYKWQPVHRLSIYKRNVEWFSYWLRPEGREPRRGAAAFQEWRKMTNDPKTSSLARNVPTPLRQRGT
ncbi:Atxe2 family lasso peptide isopeptidase [Sphingomonas sp. SORGH_AS_0950]|uniref:Atxe2 family lasso peptide isopeptidase n=1 Tax=Sphingomonas sp. SORGH_AS_0950 TaxID=3041792 RepID=UPI0027D7DD56|nr:Atxe2 family lasso peptide isopeptidase [Sphingomonas sp. SORGH_AS_0950]